MIRIKVSIGGNELPFNRDNKITSPDCPDTNQQTVEWK